MFNNLVIASQNQGRLDSRKSILSQIEDLPVIVERLIGSFTLLANEVRLLNPDVVLLDYELLANDHAKHYRELRRLCKSHRVLVLTPSLSEADEWELVKAGVRGCCQCDASPELLKHSVSIVLAGGMWIRRGLCMRLVEELTELPDKSHEKLGVLGMLTDREAEIAIRVATGAHNKEIALECGITERTVKAHLTEVFMKLGVKDRVNLALLISAQSQGKCQ